MKLALASDLHSEFYRDTHWLPSFTEEPDILVLAGDIDVGIEAVNTVNKIAETLPATTILWVAGNHEFYRQNILQTRQAYAQAFASNPRIHFLDNNSITINGWTFLGCTLWSGFDGLGVEQQNHVMELISREIPDFNLIRWGDDQQLFSPNMALTLHRESYAWLDSMLSENDPDKTIVITHFPPSLKARHPHFAITEQNAYFSAHCDTLITKHQPKYWLYGHNHWNDCIKMGNTTLISNQFGYPEEQGIIPLYDEDFSINLNL